MKVPFKKRGAGRSRSQWVTARKFVQGATLLAFLALFVASRRGGWPADLVNVPMRLDPLLGVAHLLASRTFLAGSVLALLTVLLTLVFGRAWCGWLCPLGTVLDMFSLERLRGKRPAPPEMWRSLKYYVLFTLLLAALFGNLTLLVLDPLTLLFRTLTVSLWPALDQGMLAVERAAHSLPFLAEPVTRLDAWLRPQILPPAPVYYGDTLVFALVFLAVVALNAWAPRFWCRYLCPLGGLLGWLSKAAIFRRQVGEECKGCTVCSAVCPTGTIDPAKQYASDPSECTVCLDCLEMCPRSLTTFKPHFKLAGHNRYDPGRRQALVALGVSITSLALFRSDRLARREAPHHLLPPGGRENDLLSRCVRCGECLRACPTSALQPALNEAGLEGMWTPVVLPRLGYCDYACNACGQVCPVQAIPPLPLEEKRQQIIGRAHIDEQRCIAWADHIDCIVCEEMCPLPEKAITLVPAEVSLPDGTPTTVQLPQVNRELCIGCGICEYKCPLTGEAAIRVYVPLE